MYITSWEWELFCNLKVNVSQSRLKICIFEKEAFSATNTGYF